jgi:hypothetical protein
VHAIALLPEVGFNNVADPCAMHVSDLPLCISTPTYDRGRCTIPWSHPLLFGYENYSELASTISPSRSLPC